MKRKVNRIPASKGVGQGLFPPIFSSYTSTYEVLEMRCREEWNYCVTWHGSHACNCWHSKRC